MSSEPERGVPRLFVGNLVQSITNDALRRALGRYGTVRGIERTARYAHVSLLPPAGEASAIGRAVAALNRTKWAGTELRVELAREHYMSRLRREWEENAAISAGSKRRNAAVMDSNSGAVTCLGKWRGKRVCFPEQDEPDLSVCGDDEIMGAFGDDDLVLLGKTEGLQHGVFCDDSSFGSSLSPKDLGIADSLCGPASDASRDSRDSPRMEFEGAKDDVVDGGDGKTLCERTGKASMGASREASHPQVQREAEGVACPQEDAKMAKPDTDKIPPVPRSLPAVIESTVALFGLEGGSRLSPHATTESRPVSPKRGRERVRVGADGQSKRQKMVQDEGYDADAIAAENDPTRLDVNREKRLARAVLAAMYPDALTSAAPGEAPDPGEQARLVERMRKPGLFRELVKSGGSVSHSVFLGRKGGKLVPIKGTAKRFSKYAGKSTSAIRPELRKGHTGMPDLGLGKRTEGPVDGPYARGVRRGLFRSLL